VEEPLSFLRNPWWSVGNEFEDAKGKGRKNEVKERARSWMEKDKMDGEFEVMRIVKRKEGRKTDCEVERMNEEWLGSEKDRRGKGRMERGHRSRGRKNGRMEYWLVEEWNDKALRKAKIMEEYCMGLQRKIRN
jgi:hypothetical protein